MAREEGGTSGTLHPNEEELKTSNMTNDPRFIWPRTQYNSKGPKYTLIRYRLIVQVGGRCCGAAVQGLLELPCCPLVCCVCLRRSREYLSPRSRRRTCPAYLDGSHNRKASI